MKQKQNRIIPILICILSFIIVQQGIPCNVHPEQKVNSLCTLYSTTDVVTIGLIDYCVCETCSEGYVDSSYMACCKATVFNCASCLGHAYGGCISCDSSYYIHPTSGACGNCASMSGCLSCTNLSSCSVCLGTHYKDNAINICQACSTNVTDCEACTYSTEVMCSQCKNGSILSNNTCPQCDTFIDNCLTCDSITNCTACEPLFQLTNGICLYMCPIWMDECSQCLSQSDCLACSSDKLAIDLIGPTQDCILCNVTLDNCSRCLNSDKCIQCIDDSTLYLKFDGYSSNSSEPGGFYGGSERFTGDYGECLPCITTYPLCIRCDNDFCLECVPSTKIAYTAIKQCKYCSQLLDYCVTCSSQFICTACQVNRLYILVDKVTTATCTLCSKLIAGCVFCYKSTTCSTCLVGKAVLYGCSPLVGCEQVQQKPNNTAECIRCNEKRDFLPQVINNSCTCKEGWIVGDYCNTIPGCTRLAQLKGVKICLHCNMSMNMILVKYTCICKKDFLWNGSTCIQVCGDGVLIDQQCDDGNLIDGDGCSSICQVENRYSCRFGSSSSPSKCRFTGLIDYELKSVDKVPDQNKILIAYEMKPFSILFLRMNLSSVSLMTSANTTLDRIEIEQPFIKFYVNYFQTIENASVLININYDLQLIANPNKHIKFNITSNYEPFIYDPDAGKYKAIIEKAFFYIVVCTLVVALVASLFQKMIAVQTLQTLQFVCISQVFSVKYRYVFKNMNSLILSMGQSNAIFNQELTNDKYLGLLKYSLSVMDNYSIVGLSFIVAILFFLLLKILNKRQIKDYQLARKMINRISESLLFFIAVGFYYHFVQVLQNHYIYSSNKESIFVVVLSSIFFIITSIIISAQVLNIFLDKKKINLLQSSSHNYYSRYIGYYLLFMIGTQLVLQVCICFQMFYFIYIFSSLVIFLMLLVIIKRPYKHCYHNFGLLLNLSVLAFNVGWIIVEEGYKQVIPYRIMLTLALGLCLVMVCLTAIIRVIFSLKKECDGRKQEQESKKARDQSDEMQKLQKYYYKVQQQQNPHSLSKYLQKKHPKYLQNKSVVNLQKQKIRQMVLPSMFANLQETLTYKEQLFRQQKLSRKKKLLERNNL